MKCSGENVILRGIVHVVSGFPLHFMFYRGNLDYFSNRVVFFVNTDLSRGRKGNFLLRDKLKFSDNKYLPEYDRNVSNHFQYTHGEKT